MLLDLFSVPSMSVFKAPTISTSPKCLQCSLTHESTHCLCKAPQYTHTAVVTNPTNSSYLHHKSILCFLQPGTGLTYPSLTPSSSSLLSNKPYFPGRSPLSNRISCNSQKASCSAEFSLFLIFLNVILLNQSMQNLFFNFLTNFILLTLA